MRIRWDFRLPSGRRFTDASFAPLLEMRADCSRLIRTRSLSTGLPQRATTVAGLLQLSAGAAALDGRRRATRALQTSTRARCCAFSARSSSGPTSKGAPVARTTVQKYLDLLVYLRRFRTEIGDGLTIEPFPGRSTASMAGVTDANRGSWPYTPEPIAIAVDSRCYRVSLELRRGSAACTRDLRRHGRCRAAARSHGGGLAPGRLLHALQQHHAPDGQGPHTIASAADLAPTSGCALHGLLRRDLVPRGPASKRGPAASERLRAAARARGFGRRSRACRDRGGDLQARSRLPRPAPPVDRPAPGPACNRGARSPLGSAIASARAAKNSGCVRAAITSVRASGNAAAALH